MSSPDEQDSRERDHHDHLDAISGALARLIERQDELDRRLTRIEAAAGAPDTVTPPIPNFAEPSPVRPPPLPPTAAATTGEPDEAQPGLETTFGLGWLNRVAVVTLIFGVGFLFKYAVDNHWIGPAMRVALGIAAAMLSHFLGEWLSLRGQKVFARGLTGLGLALLYLSFYAGFGFYRLIPQDPAFLLMFLTTCAAAALAVHYNSQAVALLGLAGGYLTPVLLSTGENRMSTLAAYTVVLNLGALGIARTKRWPSVEYLAWVATGFLFAGWSTAWLGDDTRVAAFTWLSVTFVLFFAASVLGSRSWLLALNTGAYFAASYAVLNPSYHGWIGAFALTLAVLHGALAPTVWNRRRELGIFLAGAAAVLLTLAIPIQFAGFRITMLWSIEAVALAWLTSRFNEPRCQIAAWLLFGLVFVRLFTRDVMLLSLNPAYTALANRRFLTFAVAAASLWIASQFARYREAQVVSYGAGHFVFLWALALEVNGWAARTADERDVSNIASTGISILMAVYAAALVVAGVTARSPVKRILGLALMALVVAKLYLLDVWSLSRGFRITAFLALGGLLLLVSYLYSRFKPALEKLWRSPPAGQTPSA